MKLFLVALCGLVAVASAEVRWSEDGQYRIVDEEPAKYEYIYDGAPVPASYLQLQVPSERLRWSEDGQYRLVGDDPAHFQYVPIDVPESYRIFPMPAELKWSEDGQYKLEIQEPNFQYVYPMPYRSILDNGVYGLYRLKAPFSYSYKQISSK